MGYKYFTPDVLNAADVNGYLMEQTVMRFATSAVRANTLTAPVEGMITYLEDTNLLQVYDGSAWVGIKTSALESTGGLTVDTSTLRVDPTNDVVGVMTATPSNGPFSEWSLDIASGRVRIGGQRNLTSAGISLGTGTPTGTWYNDTAFMGMESAANSSSVGFWHSGAWRMLIDTSGRVRMPYQPAFQAYGPVASAAHNTFPVRLLNTYINRGSVYNTSTGYFTTPVNGVYLFHWSFLSSNTNDVYRWYLRKNGVSIGDLHLRGDTSATGSEYTTNANRVWTVDLVAGDTIAIAYTADSATAFYNGGGNEYSAFGGYLIG